MYLLGLLGFGITLEVSLRGVGTWHSGQIYPPSPAAGSDFQDVEAILLP